MLQVERPSGPDPAARSRSCTSRLRAGSTAWLSPSLQSIFAPGPNPAEWPRIYAHWSSCTFLVYRAEHVRRDTALGEVPLPHLMPGAREVSLVRKAGDERPEPFWGFRIGHVSGECEGCAGSPRRWTTRAPSRRLPAARRTARALFAAIAITFAEDRIIELTAVLLRTRLANV
jgi:hypothetical protein